MSYRRGFLGIEMAQNSLAIPTFDEFFTRIGKVARVIEIGTGNGGLSLFMALYCLGVGADFITIDKQPFPKYIKPLRKLRIKRILGDVFTVRHSFTIRQNTVREGVTVILCDGGNKAREFNEFAQSLKPGDFILAHDFAESRKTWVKDEHWKCCEIELSEIQWTVDTFRLERYMKEEFTKAAWCCFRRATP